VPCVGGGAAARASKRPLIAQYAGGTSSHLRDWQSAYACAERGQLNSVVKLDIRARS
jgi:hypothetical protein